MPKSPSSNRRYRPSFAFLLLCAVLATLWLAGGASRADAMGQVVVRGAAVVALIAALLFCDRPALGDTKAVWVLLLACLLLPLIQLIPLPPAIWQALPGRGIVVAVSEASGNDLAWRPLSMVPGATVNAAASLIVPIVILALVMGINDVERRWLALLFLGLIGAASLVGMLQVSSMVFDNPFINETVGQVSGMFANRNHFALYLALGCVLAPAWAFSEERSSGWRAPTAFGLILLFTLMILASGSRGGIILGFAAIGLGLVLARNGIRRELRHRPRWVFPAMVTGAVAVLAIFALISFTARRAASIDRLFAIDQGQDMRSRGLPTVIEMIQTYFPTGAGLGSFDPVFRMHEPFGLLKFTYFNHAHNDVLEIVQDAGLPGALILVAALLWWGWASLHAWRKGPVLSRAGSAILLLVLIGSTFDYPARTPAIMAIMVVAAMWLGGAPRSALPSRTQHL